MSKPPIVMTELMVPLDNSMATVASRFAEESGRVWGLSAGQQMKLAMAVEELFVFLARDADPGERVRLMCRNGIYYTQMTCIFPYRSLPASFFNITAQVRPDDEEALSQMGLLLASRAVDRFDMVRTADALELRLVSEKEYPPAADTCDHLPDGQYRVTAVGAQEWKQLARRVYACYGRRSPAFMQYPGKLVDMLVSGEYDCITASDTKGNVAGGVVWQKVGKMAIMHGPYLFTGQTGLSREILDAALGKMARSGIICLINMEPVEEMPTGYFESIGSLDEADERGAAVLHRQLDEDQGAVSYVSPGLAGFAKQLYDRLVLPRHVQTVEPAGEELPTFSALSTAVDWKRREAMLSMLAPGSNLAENLVSHVAFLRQQAIDRILYRLDLGLPEHVLYGEEIMQAGFEPRVLLPWGGTGDVLLFGYREAD